MSDATTAEFAVRMDMGADVADRVVDQLWLRAVLVEQWRRTRIAERPAFVDRGDRLLAALDPSDDGPLVAAADGLYRALTAYHGQSYPCDNLAEIDGALAAWTELRGRKGAPAS